MMAADLPQKLVKYPRWSQEEVFSLAAEMVVKSIELAEAVIADGEARVRSSDSSNSGHPIDPSAKRG
jgi:hypothetical protein